MANQSTMESKLNNTINSIIDLDRRVNGFERVVELIHLTNIDLDHRVNDLERVVELIHLTNINPNRGPGCCQHFIMAIIIVVSAYHLVFTFGMNFESFRVAGISNLN